MRQLFLMLSLLACLTEASAQPATRPNFSGTWRVFNARDASTTLIVSHQGSKLRVTQSRFAMSVTSSVQSLYLIDGKKHFTNEIRSVSSSNRAIAKSPKSTRIKSSASWEGDRLVIMRDGEEKQEWEISEDGQLLTVTGATGKLVYQKAR